MLEPNVDITPSTSSTSSTHQLDSNATNPTQECTEQGSRTHPTGLATFRRDTSILHESTVSRLNIDQAGQQISRKGKVSSTEIINAGSKIKDSSDIENCISPIGVREPALRARTRQASHRLNLGQQPPVVKDIGELLPLTSLLLTNHCGFKALGKKNCKHFARAPA
jgi:hypothetical protein